MKEKDDDYFELDGSSLIDPSQPRYTEEQLVNAVINGMRAFGEYLGENILYDSRDSFDIEWYIGSFFEDQREE